MRWIKVDQSGFGELQGTYVAAETADHKTRSVFRTEAPSHYNTHLGSHRQIWVHVPAHELQTQKRDTETPKWGGGGNGRTD